MNILKIFTKQREIGNVGESAARKYLKKNGYKIVERNYVENGHEIDIIATNSKYICFVEVKTRTVSDDSQDSKVRPAKAVTREKQKAIISAAMIYEAFHRHEGKKFRFDVAEVYLYQDKKVKKIEYIEGAFNMNTPFQKQH